MRRGLVLVAAVGAALTPWAGAAQEQVTLAVRTVEQPNGAFPRHLFSGRISSGAAGELVTVLGSACPRDLETSVAGATSVAGGGWEAEAAGQRTAMTYRARWEGRFSEPVKVWSPIFVNAVKAGPRSVLVFVDTAPAFQNLNRKFVQLQRFDRSAGVWRAYRSMRLRRNTTSFSPYNFTATFTKVGRGLAVRVFVPRKTAAPCYLPRASDKIKT